MEGAGDRSRRSRRSRLGWRGFLMPLGAVLALAGLALGLWFLIDRQASANAVGRALRAARQHRRGGRAPRWAAATGSSPSSSSPAVALVVGVGGIWLFYAGLNAIVERLSRALASSDSCRGCSSGPALLLLTALPGLAGRARRSSRASPTAPALKNYEWALDDAGQPPDVLQQHPLARGRRGGLGRAWACSSPALVDRVKRESLAKTFIFLPLAISLVGASVIWRFVYAWVPGGQPQYGLLNAHLDRRWASRCPGSRRRTSTSTPSLLIVILIWLQTGFAMVVLSAAIKGVPAEITEAAGSTARPSASCSSAIIVPMIRGSLITVTITTAIVVLKIFDIVYVMTGGRFDTDVVANQMYLQVFQFFDVGRGVRARGHPVRRGAAADAHQHPQHPPPGAAPHEPRRWSPGRRRRRSSYRSVFVRRLPLRIAVIADLRRLVRCRRWACFVSSFRDAAGHHADRLVGRAAASLPDPQWTLQNYDDGPEHREHGATRSSTASS